MFISRTLLRGLCWLQDDGLQVFTTYVRKLIAERAREEYSALVESTGTYSNLMNNCKQLQTTTS